MDRLAKHAAGIPLRIVRNAQNVGFAAACNQGAAGLVSDFLLFLNPDTRLRAGCLEKPIEFLDQPSNHSVGVVGVQLVNSNGEVTRSCARRPSARSMIGQSLGLGRVLPSLFPPHFELEWLHDAVRQVHQVMGAFFFIRRRLFNELDGFDERFFVYFEDLDLSIRARDRGWTSVYLATARAVHHGCGSTDSIRGQRLFYLCRSRILFCLKHFTMVDSLAVILVALIIEPIVRLVVAFAALHFSQAVAIIQSYARLWVDLPDIIGAHARFTHV